MLKTLWIDKLPTEIRNILTISEGDFTKLAQIGDKLWDMIPNSLDDQILIEESILNELSQRVNALETEIKNKNRSRSRSRSRGRPRFNANGKILLWSFSMR